MSLEVNEVTLVGNLVKDPELRDAGASKVVNFALGVNRSYKTKDGEKQSEANFFDVEAWGRLAEIVDDFGSKGRRVFVRGRLKQDTWEAEDGSNRSKIKVVAHSVDFIDGPKQEDAPAKSAGGKKVANEVF